MKVKNNLAAKFLCFWLLFTSLFTPTAISGGIPVFDSANVTQATISAVESVNQTLKQLEQYNAQLQQLEDQIRNSATPSTYLWSQAESTMNNMLKLQEQVQGLYSQAGGLDAYMRKFSDVDDYKSSEYFSAPGVSAQQRQNNMARAKDGERIGLELQKRANEDFSRTIEAQQQLLKRDAQELQRLQQMAGTAQGRMEALQYGNQFSANISGQLLQLRASLQAMHTAQVAQAQTAQDVESRRMAADEAATKGTFQKVREPAVPNFQ